MRLCCCLQHESCPRLFRRAVPFVSYVHPEWSIRSWDLEKKPALCLMRMINMRCSNNTLFILIWSTMVRLVFLWILVSKNKSPWIGWSSKDIFSIDVFYLCNVKFLVTSLYTAIHFTAWGIIYGASDYFKALGPPLASLVGACAPMSSDDLNKFLSSSLRGLIS